MPYVVCRCVCVHRKETNVSVEDPIVTMWIRTWGMSKGHQQHLLPGWLLIPKMQWCKKGKVWADGAGLMLISFKTPLPLPLLVKVRMKRETGIWYPFTELSLIIHFIFPHRFSVSPRQFFFQCLFIYRELIIHISNKDPLLLYTMVPLKKYPYGSGFVVV